MDADDEQKRRDGEARGREPVLEVATEDVAQLVPLVAVRLLREQVGPLPALLLQR